MYIVHNLNSIQVLDCSDSLFISLVLYSVTACISVLVVQVCFAPNSNEFRQWICTPEWCLCRNVVKHLNVTHFCSANIAHLSPLSSSYGMRELHHNQFQERTTNSERKHMRNWKVQLLWPLSESGVNPMTHVKHVHDFNFF